MATIYPYAVIPSAGCTGSGSHPVTSTHQTAEAAIRAAARLTRKYREGMEKHGGSSGGYVAVTWNATRHARFWDDARPSALEES